MTLRYHHAQEGTCSKVEGPSNQSVRLEIGDHILYDVLLLDHRQWQAVATDPP